MKPALAIMVLLGSTAAPLAWAGPPDPPPFRVRSWSLESGLPHPRVTALARSDDGLLWLATPRGLVSFDGISFRTGPGATDSAPGNITALARGRGNRIWIGTDDSAVLRMEQGSVHRETALSAAGLTGQVTGLAEDDSGVLWISTSGGQFAGLRPSGQLVPTRQWRDRLGPTPVAKAGPDGRVFLGGESGWWLAGDPGSRPLPPPGLGKSIDYFAPGIGGKCWFGFTGGTLLAGGSDPLCRTEFSLPPSTAPPCTAVDSTGGLWVARQTGALHYCGENGSHAEIPLHDRRGPLSVLALLADSEGLVWVGTDKGGLSQIAPALFQHRNNAGIVDSRPTDAGGSSLAPVDKRVVIEPHGVGVVTTGGLGALAPPPLPNSPAAGGDLTNVLSALATLSEPGSLKVIFHDRDQSLWIGTGGPTPLIHHSGGTSRPITFAGTTPADVQAITRDDQGTLWIGTSTDGVFKLDRGGIARPVTLPFEKLGTRPPGIRNIRAAGHSVWFTTAGSGLLRWKNGSFAAANRGTGLPDDDLVAMEADHLDGLWLSGPGGIFRISRGALDSWFDDGGPFPRPVVFDASDGIKSIEGYADSQGGSYLAADGNLWFTSSAGLYEIRPSLFRIPSDPPAAVILECLADGVRLPRPDEIPPGTRHLEIHFTGSALAHPESTEFACKLSPDESGWREMGKERKITYTGLPHGRYRFEVVATDRFGRRSAAPATWDFAIPTPFWRSPWFAWVYPAAALAVAAFFLKRIARRRLNELRDRERIRQALDDERRRIARDMHDELGTGLCEIALLGNRLEESIPQHADAGRVASRARELVGSIDETVWMLNPRNDTLENLASYLAHAVAKWLHDSPLRPRFEIECLLGDLPVPTAIRRHLYLACKEIVHNAVKHSGGSELWLRIHTRGTGFLIEISDNGRGMPEIRNANRNGLANLHERMAEIRGTLEITSTAAGGTRVSLLISRPASHPLPLS